MIEHRILKVIYIAYIVLLALALALVLWLAYKHFRPCDSFDVLQGRPGAYLQCLREKRK
jgi:hypothetical protein